MSNQTTTKKLHKARIVIWVLAAAVAGVVFYMISHEQTTVAANRAQETTLRTSLWEANVPVLLIDETETITLATPAVHTLTGYDPGELIGRPLGELMPVAYREIHSKARAKYDAATHAATAPKPQIYCQLRKKDGRNIPVMASIIGSYAYGGMAVITPASPINIQERLYNMALESAKVGVWWWEVDPDRLVWDARMHELYGTEPANGWQPSYEGFIAAVHPDDREWVNKVISTCVADKGYYRAVFRVVHSDGAIFYIRAYGQVFEEVTGTIFAGVNILVTADEYTGGPAEVGL